MGWVLSKLWRKKSTLEELEALESKLENLSKSKTDTVAWQKKVLGYLVTYSIVFYLIAAVIVYFKFFPEARTRNEQLFLLLPFLVTPMIIFLLRKVLTWWYHRKVGKGDQQLAKLRERKVKILDEVMEKETYKVAKQILDKYAPHKVQSPPRGGVLGSQGGSGARGGSEIRRRPGPPNQPPARLNASLPVSTIQPQPTSRPGQGISGGKQEIPSGVPAISGPPPGGRGGGPPGLGRGAPIGPPGLGRGAPGPPLPRPVLPRERGYMDKFVEYLVGDGPTNRFALICRQCQSHNGMALRDEFEYIAYRCCYCYYWNPARKQRPVAPRLPDPTIAAAMSSAVSSSSSDSSDQSGQESAEQSRRNSVTEPVTIGGEEKETSNENAVQESSSGVEVEELIEKVHALGDIDSGGEDIVTGLITDKLGSLENEIVTESDKFGSIEHEIVTEIGSVENEIVSDTGEAQSDTELSEEVNVIEGCDVIERCDGIDNESDNRMEVDS